MWQSGSVLSGCRDLCVRYQMKYREKVHGHSNSLASKEELQVRKYCNIVLLKRASDFLADNNSKR